MLFVLRPSRATAHRRTVVRAGAWIAAAVLTATAVPVVTGLGVTGAAAAPVTVTGTVSGRHAWNPQTHDDYPDAPSVTVDQTQSLTDQVVHVTWQHFTPSLDAGGGIYPYFNSSTVYPVTVLQCKGTNPADPTRWGNYDFGPDCYAATPDSPDAEDGAGNRVTTLTGSGGDGEAFVHVEDALSNNFLKCDSTHACSLVVLPNWGGIQDPGDAPASSDVDCEGAAAHQADANSAPLVKHGPYVGPYGRSDTLGAACSWGDRFVVPLSFAPTQASCPNSNYAFATEGVPMLIRTLAQWQAGWCTAANPLTFDYDGGTNESLARSAFLQGSGALTSSIDSALVTRPATTATAGRPFTYAPIDNSAITVAYHVDDQKTGKLITDLTLDARLVAKLITQSYALDFGCANGETTSGPTCDPAVAGNLVSIFDDPEFLALNSQYTRADFPLDSDLNRGQFAPLVVSGNSDLVYELTRWIATDTKAMAFIDGTADDGMHVNKYYENEILPLTQFQNLDPGYTAPDNADGSPGQSTMQVTWNPVNGLTNVVQSLVTDRPSAVYPVADCTTKPCVFKRWPAVAVGQRALFAVVGLNDSTADRFPAAKLVNAADKAVGPTDSGLSAGYAAMTTNPDKITQSADYSTKDAVAYPLVTHSYAMLPTCGLTSAKQAAMRNFLGKVGSSQTVGLKPGELAPGNVPLTSAQQTQLAAAAKALRTTACTPRSANSTPSESTDGSGNGGAGPSSGTDPQTTRIDNNSATNGTNSNAGQVNTTPKNGSSAAGPAGSDKRSLAAYGVKHGDGSDGIGFALPLLLILTTLLLIGGPGLFVLMQTGSGAAAAARFRARLGL